jgi:ABC-type proline/glycine betaine transport system permease subunit
MTWRVMVPAARESLMVGMNQVIMLSLNMVIIASMIGAGGLGFDVLAALRRLDFGAGLEAGFAIVALAIAMDRLSQAFRRKALRSVARNADELGSCARRHPYLCRAWHWLSHAALGYVIPAIRTYPEACSCPPAPSGRKSSAGSTSTSSTQLEAIKNAMLLNVLIPFKRFLGGLPWLGVVALLALPDYGLAAGVWRCRTACLPLFIAMTGQWEKAMITVYLCGISAVLAALIGLPIGIYSATRDRLWKLGATRHRHAADPAELRLSDARGDAVPRRRFHRDDRRRRFRHRAGHPLHCTRHPQGRSETDRGRHRAGLHPLADPHQVSGSSWRCPKSCSVSTRPSCLPCRCWSSPRWSEPAILARKSISR